MENLLTRHRNVTILVVVLFAEVIGLAVQVKRTTDSDSTRLIRVWTVSVLTPFEKGFVEAHTGVRDLWRNYFYLRGVRNQNRELQEEIARLRLERVRLNEDAAQARRLQLLLGFKEQYISQTMAAQVIGSSGSDVSRLVYIDKGSSQGIKQDMPVITAAGLVGRVLQVFPYSSQVLLINDASSGLGAILEKSRSQGVLKGSAAGETILEKVTGDEQVEAGETVLTSGGDRIFPKGLRIGTVSKVSPGQDFFLNIRVKPAADLSSLEEVLVITRVEEKAPVSEPGRPVRASDILSARLPSVPPKATTASPKTSKVAPSLPVGAPKVRKAALPADAVSGVPALVNNLPKEPVGLVPPRVTIPKDATADRTYIAPDTTVVLGREKQPAHTAKTLPDSGASPVSSSPVKPASKNKPTADTTKPKSPLTQPPDQDKPQ
ncbi:MAG TPA: rod shape-determining protein MreC [Terriglobales bacterium]|nr:rod shape-determining protein MreC [Terriglobales bacterium]